MILNLYRISLYNVHKCRQFLKNYMRNKLIYIYINVVFIALEPLLFEYYRQIDI